MLWAKFSGTHNLSGTELIYRKPKYHENDSDGVTRSDDGTTFHHQNDKGSFRVLGAEGELPKVLDEHLLEQVLRLND